MLCFSLTVKLAHIFFPSEAKVARDIAKAEATSQYSGLLLSKISNGNLKEVDLDKIPIAKRERDLAKMAALIKTGTC